MTLEVRWKLLVGLVQPRKKWDSLCIKVKLKDQSDYFAHSITIEWISTSHNYGWTIADAHHTAYQQHTIQRRGSIGYLGFDKPRASIIKKTMRLKHKSKHASRNFDSHILKIKLFFFDSPIWVDILEIVWMPLRFLCKVTSLEKIWCMYMIT